MHIIAVIVLRALSFAFLFVAQHYFRCDFPFSRYCCRISSYSSMGGRV